MDIIFYQLGDFEQTLRTILSYHLKPCPLFYSLTNQKDIGFPRDRKYMVFYLLGENGAYPRIGIRQGDEIITATTIALCESSDEGIKALENGSDYALLLPLKEEKLIHCYEHFSSKNQKEEKNEREKH